MGNGRWVSVLTLVVVVVLWQAGTAIFHVPIWLLPSPSAVGTALWRWQPVLPGHVAVTLAESLGGFLFGAAVGAPLGVAVVGSPLLRRSIYPLLLASQSVPKVALAPILLLWAGYGVLPKVLIGGLVCFFPILVGMATGLESVPVELLDLARSLSASPIQTFLRIRGPAALPSLFGGLKVGISLAVVGAVIGEFVGASQGLGYLILVSTAQANTPLAFGAIVILAGLSMLLYYGLEGLERVMVPWAPGGAR